MTVSNLGYVSKLVEHVAAAQLVNHIERHSMMEVHQSAYCPFHSTESALLKVKSNITRALENQEVACLILLDLSAAFDTIVHDILLNRLETRFAVLGVALNWLRSYLTDRTQAIEVGAPLGGWQVSIYLLEVRYSTRFCSGSDLILFTIYTAPIGDICRKHQVQFHL